MKCHECDYYSENNGYYGEWNGCKLLGFEYFQIKGELIIKRLKDIIDYLDSLRVDKENQLKNKDFSNVPNMAISLEYDINALKIVIDIIKMM